jgi:hypothetical protein
MDFLNKAKEQMSGNNANAGANTNMGQQQQQQGGAVNNQNEDYGDKGISPLSLIPPSVLTSEGLDFIEKKTGHTMGRDTNEKITDGARGLYEKATGYVLFPTLPHFQSGEQAS